MLTHHIWAELLRPAALTRVAEKVSAVHMPNRMVHSGITLELEIVSLINIAKLIKTFASTESRKEQTYECYQACGLHNLILRP